MANRKKDEIMAKLSALKPNIPTNTRASVPVRPSEKKLKKTGQTKPSDSRQLIRDNIASFEQLRQIMADESHLFFTSALENWQKVMNIYSEFLVNNLLYFINTFYSRKKN